MPEKNPFQCSSVFMMSASRYGPPIDGVPEQNPSESSGESNASSQRTGFRNLLDKVMAASDPQHIPSILTKEMELILSLSGEDGVQVIQSILDEARTDQGEEAANRVAEFIDLVLSFAEEFVQEAVDMDDVNKRLLGKIILTLSDKEQTARNREDALNKVLQEEKENFTPGFLRHLEGECERIANAPKMSPESSRLLEIIRMIQARVLEELGKDLGEAAQVLGQLIGYESSSERLAVLEAGLTVRGLDFALELIDLTDEALQGFERVSGGVDPGLLECVKGINEHLKLYKEREEEGEFQ